MKWRDWLEKWGMTSLKIKLGVLETEWKLQDPDKNAAWEMYVELLTRITAHRVWRIRRSLDGAELAKRNPGFSWPK